jgi:hypothetical protein
MFPPVPRKASEISDLDSFDPALPGPEPPVPNEKRVVLLVSSSYRKIDVSYLFEVGLDTGRFQRACTSAQGGINEEIFYRGQSCGCIFYFCEQ